ncbi:plasminogen-binding N-terminal domain-containing protein [Campylobacter sp. VBCF_06 NA8]|uniref:plasminogen-binding N-terminal domain-containing protein n=1 Tax=unclassified Campylobacter TaxID=2593542 RepID=UPI0022E9ACD7|nr:MULTISPECIES: plasminogen-binding N-terminal domain-containing protein [unclassified Campylobacter]MDA3046322.1 plasminogen-binding N-terminal domain-containing protein [Campylobacter sp. VBCF_06 NA8]MDA3047215.1 plasminogen-binding N-terminal domain-containing protein [Campylobacter sp. JMF_08 NE1]MDA3061724.1 plasminogen-binding N-terminal domain-containing protein [Campylobacter sp. JMF_14 EL1]MDA3073170.1 plasminogen-binding N-terminal domain-containing protein [Campylobacter sp. JMF_10 
MKRILLALGLFLSSVFGAEFYMPPYETLIFDVQNGEAVIADNPAIMVGSAGIVMHDFGNGENAIIARAVVSEKSGAKAKIRFEVFGMLEQKALPLPKILPANGDKVILNYLYDRALIVAPNAEIYAQIVQAFPNIEFIHPDLGGAYLRLNSKPNPSRDDFRKICAKNSTGLIFVAMNEKSVFADCGSFKPLRTYESGKVAYYTLPFYSRVGDIKTVFWDFTNGPISDYDRHYSYLLGLDDE